MTSFLHAGTVREFDSGAKGEEMFMQKKKKAKSPECILILMSPCLHQMDVRLRHSVRNRVKFKFVGAAALSTASWGVKRVCGHPGVQEEEEVEVVVVGGWMGGT